MADCEATVFMADDRWGGFLQRCELGDHDGDEHELTMGACTPPAVLRWTGGYAPAIPAAEIESGDVLIRGDLRWRVETAQAEQPRLGGLIVRLRCRNHRDEIEDVTMPADQPVHVERVIDRG